MANRILIMSIICFCLSLGQAFSADKFTDRAAFISTMRAITLPGSNTFIVIKGDGDSSAAVDQQAHMCDVNDGVEDVNKSADFHCYTEDFHYGCSPDCQCCYYEEHHSYEVEDGDVLSQARRN